MLNASDTLYELLTPAIRRNPHPVLAVMREDAPVHQTHHSEMGAKPFLLTRYDDCVTLLKDDERFTKDFMKLAALMPVDEGYNTDAMMINRHMLTVDPPDHTRLRSLVHKAFTPKMIREFEGRIQQIADDLLDRALEKNSIDLISEYAVPLPITVIAELLGVPSEDQARFRDWSQTIIIEGTRSGDMEKVGLAAMEFMMYFHDLFDKRRGDPREDLISGLLQVEEDGDKLDAQELIGMVFLLLAAGHETTVNLIGNGTLALLQHPDQMRMLQNDPSLIKTAVEEMLRYDGPIGISTLRWALHDVEWRGVTIPAGSMVCASLLAANRDPREFPDPDRFDITRSVNRHIAFGSGIHYCLGAPLARMEGAIAINSLLRRLPNLALDCDPNELEWNETLLLHGMTALPVRY
jgi:cytochrome P450 PksS